MYVLQEYLWLLVVGSFAAFFFGWGIGANDVANAFSTSVATKTLTLKQAVIIASIFDFIGSMALGHVITGTIQGGIADYNAFTREPEVYAYGMVCAMVTAGIWQIVGSYFEVNVSSSQSIIGSIIGFSLCYKGNSSVLWLVNDTKSFPPYKGIVVIVLQWFVSPIMAAIGAGITFFLLRLLVLRSKDGFKRAFWVLPPFVMVATWINIYFLLLKGAGKELEKNKSWNKDREPAWVAAVIAGGMGLVAAAAVPILKARAEKHFSNMQAEAAAQAAKGEEPVGVVVDKQEQAAKAVESESSVNEDDMTLGQKLAHKAKKLYQLSIYGLNANVDQYTKDEDAGAVAVYEAAEVFDPKTEFAFGYLQVFSAICVMIAHGAGEAGYMAGPLSAIYQVVTEGKVSSKLEPPYWILFISAISMVIGLAQYGYTTIRSTGHRLAKMSPSRGFAAELTQALIVMIGAQFGLPVGGSMCIIGCVAGVGLLEGHRGVNWVFLGRQLFFWILTLIVCGISTAALFCQAAYAPSIISGKYMQRYEDRIANLTQQLYKDFSTTLATYHAASNTPGVLPRLNVTSLTSQINKADTAVKNSVNPKNTQSVKPEVMLGHLYKALALYQQNTILTVGQRSVYAGAAVCNSNVTADILSGKAANCTAPKMLPKAYATSFP